jgi:hypothetical protein
MTHQLSSSLMGAYAEGVSVRLRVIKTTRVFSRLRRTLEDREFCVIESRFPIGMRCGFKLTKDQRNMRTKVNFLPLT